MTSQAEFWNWRADALYCEDVAVESILQEVGSPVYIYSQGHIKAQIAKLQSAFPTSRYRIFFAAKANPHLHILALMHKHGVGIDTVSDGEIARALHAGVPASNIIFSGVGKTTAELKAAFEHGLFAINIESYGEWVELRELAAKSQRPVRVALRLNPAVQANTHKHISTGHSDTKFGLSEPELQQVLADVAREKYVRIVGIASHIGSQLRDLSPVGAAARFLSGVAKTMTAQGLQLEFIDVGGGFAIAYDGQSVPDFRDYARVIEQELGDFPGTIVIEPGRFLVAESGRLFTRVLRRKTSAEKEFLIVDAGMTECIRPALYNAHHEIIPIKDPKRPITDAVDIVGPVCETTDFFAHDRPMPTVAAGEYLALTHAGAYCAAMFSNYNARRRPAEIMVTEKTWHQISRPQTQSELWQFESI